MIIYLYKSTGFQVYCPQVAFEKTAVWLRLGLDQPVFAIGLWLGNLVGWKKSYTFAAKFCGNCDDSVVTMQGNPVRIRNCTCSCNPRKVGFHACHWPLWWLGRRNRKGVSQKTCYNYCKITKIATTQEQVGHNNEKKGIYLFIAGILRAFCRFLSDWLHAGQSVGGGCDWYGHSAFT